MMTNDTDALMTTHSNTDVDYYDHTLRKKRGAN